MSDAYKRRKLENQDPRLLSKRADRANASVLTIMAVSVFLYAAGRALLEALLAMF